MTDAKLKRLLNESPDEGMRIVIERHSGSVTAVIRARLRPPAFSVFDVEECAADTFAEFWRDRESFDPDRGSLGGWLARLALNNANDRLRRYYRESGNVPLENASDAAEESAVGSAAESVERRAALISALASLGKKDRELIVRKFFLGQSSKEIASDMGLTVSNVDTRTHRTLKKLRKIMGEDENG
ncbi:MAG: sigma-70 family RNA polymerase sigma factor [Clostridia bacterium]|nr:sigma-70 family RNA polymerase sigma factor [Clostridia bacterium]